MSELAQALLIGGSLLGIAALASRKSKKSTKKKDLKEGYLPSQVVYLEGQNSLQAAPAEFAYGRATKLPQEETSFRTFGNGLAPITPRMWGGDYAAVLRGAQPPYGVQAVPTHSVENFAKMAPVGNKDALSGLDQETQDQLIYNKYQKNLEYLEPAELLPKDDMSGTAYGKAISDPETFVYDRFIYANQRRRNLYGADFIRGDLMIAPNNTGWFQVSVKPHLDLRIGSTAGWIGPDYETTDTTENLTITNQAPSWGIDFRRTP